MKLIAVYVIVTFLCAIPYTQAQNNQDNARDIRYTGKVNLLRSYWYESYAIRDMLRYCAGKEMVLMPVIVDNAALVVYGREYKVWVTTKNGWSPFVITAYPRTFGIDPGTKVFPPQPNFMSVYDTNVYNKPKGWR